ncbi:uncharacterized protein LOC132565691 [Ylistrum balloti]|uniref:uncharacterized protein LOC132565691 n=1 Tax=Ylistrum balloti TaxID=509963 RepID=UPI002905BF29|nr:uncharacterized protein LOC132565691 [Ylistrum balloti]
MTIGGGAILTEGLANDTKRTLAYGTEVRVAGLFNIYNIYSEEKCSEINIASVQALESAFWIFEHLNSHQYIPGVKIVLKPYKTCRSPQLTSLQTARIVSEADDEVLMGVIGPGTSAETNISSRILSSLPGRYRLPQVVYEPTSSLFTNKDVYNNLFRVIPPDNTQVKTIISLLKELHWNYISVIREDDVYAINATDYLQTLANTENICISSMETVGPISTELQDSYQSIMIKLSAKKINGIVFFGSYDHAKSFINLCNEVSDRNIPSVIFSDSASSTTVLHTGSNVLPKTFFLSPPTRVITEFVAHWEKIASNKTFLMERAIKNPWLNETVLGTNQSLYVQYSIKAAFVMAMALRSLHIQRCGEAFNGACPEFIKADRNSLINIISNLSINFTDFPFRISSFDQDDLKIRFDRYGEIQLVSPHVPMYEVYRYKDCTGSPGKALCKVKVAHYRNDILTCTDSFQGFTGFAQCNGSCPECMTSNLSSKVIDKPGDLIVVGLMPLHDQGSVSPLACGNIRPSIGLDIAMAIGYVVEEVNNASDMFPGKTIGYRIMDTCNDPLVTQKRILDMLSKEREFSNRILGVVGPLGSTATMAAASIFSSLGIVQVGCCSSARMLSNTNIYPTFLRVSTSIYKQAELMVKLAKKMGVNYIQIVHSEGEFGESGRDAVFQLAQEYGICVVNNTLSVNENSNEYEVLSHIRKHTDARLVMFFLRSHKASVVAKALHENMKKDDDFIFMASVSWGKREGNIFGRQKLRGMITISQEMGYDIGYQDYLLSLNVSQERYQNSFIERFAEARLGCYFESSFNKSEKTKCTDDHMIKKGTLDPWHAFVLNAAYALLKGADIAFKESRMFDKDMEYSFLLDQIKKVQKKYGDSVGSRTYMFDETGDGTVGFHIYNAQINTTSGQLMYVKVGQWQDDLLIFNQTLLDDKTKSLDSTCKSPSGYCARCYQGNDDELYV